MWLQRSRWVLYTELKQNQQAARRMLQELLLAELMSNMCTMHSMVDKHCKKQLSVVLSSLLSQFMFAQICRSHSLGSHKYVIAAVCSQCVDVLPLVCSRFSHMQRELESDQKLKMRESCTFSNQIFHVVLVFSFPCHSSFRINTTDCPRQMVDAHISTRNFLIQQLLVQRFNKFKIHAKNNSTIESSHVLKRRVQNKTMPNREILQPPSPLHCKPCAFFWIIIPKTICQCDNL